MEANTTNTLECAVCFEKYDDTEHKPKFLPCGHTCCLRCVQSLENVSGSKLEEVSDVMKPGRPETPRIPSVGSGKVAVVTCPICRSVTNGDLAFLPTNFAMLSVMVSSAAQPPTTVVVHDCSQCKKTKREVVSHCETCNQFLCQAHSVNHQDDFEDHKLVPTSISPPKAMCPNHKKELEYFCRDCKCCLCANCFIEDHRTHNITSLQNAKAEMASSIGSKLSPLGAACADMSLCVYRLSELGNDLAKKELDIAGEVRETLQVLHAAVDKRGEELLSSLPSKRLQVEAHKHSIQSLLTQVTDKIQSCRNQLQSEDMIQVLLSEESITHLLSIADDEVKSIDWREEKYDNHLEFKYDEDEMIQIVQQYGKADDENVKVAKYRRLAVKVNLELKAAMNELCRDMEGSLSNLKWVDAESRLIDLLSNYFDRLHALNLNGERFDDILQPMELEWNAFAADKRAQLRQNWEDVVSSEFDAVLQDHSRQLFKKLDVSSVESFRRSCDMMQQEISNSLSRVSDYYGPGDIHVQCQMEVRVCQATETSRKYCASYEGLATLAVETRQYLRLTSNDIKENVKTMRWGEIESRLSSTRDECELRLARAVDEVKLSEKWNGMLSRQFQSMLDDLLMTERVELRHVLDGWLMADRAESKEEFREIGWQMRPCQNELECRRTIVAILKQTRGEANWNGRDDGRKRFNWREDLNLGEWDGDESPGCKRIQVDRRGMIKKLFLNNLGMRGELPSIVGSLSTLTELNVCGNDLMVLPESIGNLTGLNHLCLSNNRLAVLPEAIGNLTSLTELYLDNNVLAALPDSIWDLTSLIWLYINNNQLTNISEAIGNCVNLRELRINFNRLLAIPEAIGNVASLKILDVRHNQISVMPRSLACSGTVQTYNLTNPVSRHGTKIYCRPGLDVQV